MPESINATAISYNRHVSAGASGVVIGDTRVFSPIPTSTEGFFFAVVDLSTLEVVAQAAPVSNSSVPPEIAPYANKEGYFLFFITQLQSTRNLPQGDLYSFLMNSGAGAALENVEQIVEQIGTGFVLNYAYVLAGSLDSGDLPGFEVYSLDSNAILPMQFVPYDMDGKTMYAPSRHSTP
ncbi:MAG: hypothetical protein AAGI52_08610 [Bacteroidota bacterium]